MKDSSRLMNPRWDTGLLSGGTSFSLPSLPRLAISVVELVKPLATGQSPIAIPGNVRDTCHTDLSGYQFESGDCTWDDLNFRIVLNGVIVNATEDAGCSLGRMKIPGNSNWFNALQFHIHTGSEHSVEGEVAEPTKYHPAELHIVHAEETMESFAVFGMFIDKNPEDEDQDHEFFENYLQGWESTGKVALSACSSNTLIICANNSLLYLCLSSSPS